MMPSKYDPLVETKYMLFQLHDSRGKTAVYHVTSKHGDLLGIIKWFGAWKKYTFWTLPDIVLDSGCMDDISSFMRRLMADRRTQ